MKGVREGKTNAYKEIQKNIKRRRKGLIFAMLVYCNTVLMLLIVFHLPL